MDKSVPEVMSFILGETDGYPIRERPCFYPPPRTVQSHGLLDEG